jgi:hypothetical protein
VDNLYWKCPDSKAWCANNGGPSPLTERAGLINTTCCNITEFMFNAPDPVLYTQAEQMTLPISTLLFSSETALDESPITTSIPLTTTTESTTLISAMTTSTTDLSSKQNTTSSSSGGSNSTSVGIGVGVGLGVSAIALSVVLYVLLQRKRRQRNELRGQEIAEMPSSDVRHELNGHEVAAEIMAEKTTYEMRA